jgi:hypothetical protein
MHADQPGAEHHGLFDGWQRGVQADRVIEPPQHVELHPPQAGNRRQLWRRAGRQQQPLVADQGTVVQPELIRRCLHGGDGATTEQLGLLLRKPGLVLQRYTLRR